MFDGFTEAVNQIVLWTKVEKSCSLSDIRLIVWEIAWLRWSVTGGQVRMEQGLKLSTQVIDGRTLSCPDIEHSS